MNQFFIAKLYLLPPPRGAPHTKKKKKKKPRGEALEGGGGGGGGGHRVELGNKKLTETDKFSREFFSIVATLNQNGLVDLATVDKLGSSLADRIKNTLQRKMFT